MTIEPVAIVTGAGQNLGRAVAFALARAEYRLVLVDQDDDKIRALVAELSALNAETVFCHINRYDSLHIHNIMAGALDNFGRVDAIAHCETDFFEKQFLETNLEDFDDFLVKAQRAAFLLNHAVARQIMHQSTGPGDGGVGNAALGAIVNVVSLDAVKTHQDRALLAMLAGGIAQLTKATAMVLAPYGARANAVALSWVRHTYLAQHHEWDPGADYAPPLGRRASIDEAAAAISFLLSPEASYLTGQVLPLDGGLCARYPGPPIAAIPSK